MRIGCLQYQPESRQPRRNRERLESLLLNTQADILVLPELALSGYTFQSPEELSHYAEDADGESCRWFQDISRKTGTLYVYGYPERGAQGTYNSAAAVDAQGLVHNYRKLHLYDTEKQIFLPGNQNLSIFSWRQTVLGLLVCFDHLFPEAARTLALQGAQIICHPSNLVLKDYAQLTTRVRALENRIFWILANRIGSEGPLRFTGRSQITDIKGSVIASAGDDEQAVLTADIDASLALSKQINPRNDLFGDRAAQYYSKG